MKFPHRSTPLWMSLEIISVAVLLLVASLSNSFGDSDLSPPISQEELRLGERMYRDGILPSGEPMQAFARGDLPVPGTAFSCSSCHLRSGLGSFEGGVITLPTNGPKLFQPFRGYSSLSFGGRRIMPRPIVEENLKFYPKPPNRPVYTDISLASVIRYGVDPIGRVLSDVMPRYHLQKEDMKLLVAYLKALSSHLSPGVSDSAIHFATVVTEDVSPAYQNAMLVPLENYVRVRNETNFQDPEEGVIGSRSRLMAETAFTPRGVAVRKLVLSRWVLKGPPETWRSQLEEYNRREPVFALLGGITLGDWEPIHRFCEENQIPNLFPITDFPVVSTTDWYTLYLSKGLYQEGERAARFLQDREELKGKPVLQITRDTRQGRALARGFLEAWHDLGLEPPQTVLLKEGGPLTAEHLRQEVSQKRPAVVVLWDGPESFKALESLVTDKERPVLVLLSSSLLGKELFTLSERIRNFTYLTYPYGVSQTLQERLAQVRPAMGVKKFNPETNTERSVRIAQQSYILTTILNMALLEMRGNYYRDNLLDVIGMLMDQDVPLYDHLSFGPGQRYASKGCYIVQLGEGPKPSLVKKSDWVDY